MYQPRSMLRHSQAPNDPFDVFGSAEAPAPRWPIIRLARAVAEGLMPLVILAAVLGVFWEISAIARLFATPYGIDAIQRAELATVGGGLAVGFVIFLITAIRTLQGVRERHRASAHLEATITLACFAFTLLILLMPLLLALAQPQHPAP